MAQLFSRGLPRLLKRAELPADTAQLARFLLGKLVVRDVGGAVMIGRIVETEAYPLGDASCHAFIGRTARNASLFLRRGHAYVYFTYGMWQMLNVSSEAEGEGAGVLIRALEPLQGQEIMQENRGKAPPRELTAGPGRLCQALAIDVSLDGIDLCRRGPLWLGYADPVAPRQIGVSVRIGISREVDRPLRFYLRGNRFISGPRQLSP
jgi:DNA-3-methyladenine glycosylase